MCFLSFSYRVVCFLLSLLHLSEISVLGACYNSFRNFFFGLSLHVPFFEPSGFLSSSTIVGVGDVESKVFPTREKVLAILIFFHPTHIVRVGDVKI